jgi:hypothetical protein
VFEEAFLTAIAPYIGEGYVDFIYIFKTAVVKNISSCCGARRHGFDEFTHQEGD